MSATALNYRVVCEISDALKYVTASKLYSLQARISFNGFDFSEMKKDSECIILCHSFNPLSITPDSCLSPTPSSVTSSSLLSDETEKALEAESSSRPMMKEICVVGESFLPSRCLPYNFTVQAIVTAIFPIFTSETEKKEEINGDTINSEINNTSGYTGVKTVSTVVPVRCMSQTMMYFTPPTINHFIDLLDKKGNEEEYNLIKTTLQFQLVSKDNAAARETSGFYSTHDKKDKCTHTTERKEENIQWLCPPEIGIGREDLVLHLFTNQAIIISPAVTRRHGGTAHKVRGALHGGFRCCPYPELVRVLLKVEGDDGEVLIDQPQVTVHKERTSTVIKTVLTQDEDTAVASGLPPTSSNFSLTDLDDEFKFHFVMPDANISASVLQGTSKPLQYVVTSLLFDNDSDKVIAPTFRLLLFDGVKIGAVVNPKGGHFQGSQVIVAVTGIPDCVKNCIIQIRGDEKDKNAISITPNVSLNYVEILGVQVRDGHQEISFLLPESSSFQILTPVMMKKSKMYYIHISIDEGSSFDSSAAAVLQIQ